MMIKIKFYITAAFFSILIIGVTSCETDNIQDVIPTNNLVLNKEGKEEVFNIFLKLDIDKNLVQEVHKMAISSIQKGNDEKVLMKEIISYEKNLPTTMQPLIGKICKEIKGNSRSFQNSDKLDQLENSNVYIYWPYSENWDGEELPALLLNSFEDDKDTDDFNAFVISNNNGVYSYKQIIVNEEYAKQHPVWVINQEENSSTLLDDLDYCNNIESILTRSSNNTEVNEWVLDSMRVTHQYDSWINGGSEFEIYVLYPTISGNVDTNTKIRITFTREDINKKRTKKLSAHLNSNWRPEQLSNGIVVYETDSSSGKDSVEMELEYKNGDTILKSKYKIDVGNRDEFILQERVDRDGVLSYYPNYYYIANGNEDVILVTRTNKRYIY